ncbi:MAG: hypothetical protein ACOY90_01720 [Candidatus Zhuqueibacterota bacterium]
MTHAVDEEVVEFNEDFEKFTADIQFLVDEVKQEVQKTLDDFQHNQKMHAEKITQLEAIFQGEIDLIRENFKRLQDEIESFKQSALSIVENNAAAESSGTQNQYAQRLDDIERKFDSISQFSDLTPDKLREELIAGIRMLGERVSKAISDINGRFENLTASIATQPAAEPIPPKEPVEAAFAPIKESGLLEKTDFELVPRDAVKRLSELFRKQSSAIKSFIDKQESKLTEFESLLRTYDKENSTLLELLEKRVKRNFIISIMAIIAVLMGSVFLNLVM